MRQVIWNNQPSLISQKGTSLLEALIAILLMTIVGLGITYSLTRAVYQQGKLNAQTTVLNELRGELQTAGMNDSCNTTGVATSSAIALTSTSNSQSTVNRQCTLSLMSVTVSAASKTILLPVLTYTVADERLGSTSLLLKN